MSSLSEAARGLPPSKGAARNKVEVRLQGSHPSSGIHQVSTYPCLWSTLHMLLPFPPHDYPVGLQLGHSLTLRGRAFPRAVHVGDTITTRTRRVSAARLAFCLLCLSVYAPPAYQTTVAHLTAFHSLRATTLWLAHTLCDRRADHGTRPRTQMSI